jgi:RHS repeat-associated protein
LRSQVNPRGQETRYAYDRISRLISRTEPEGTTTWTRGRSTASRNVGSIIGVSAPGYSEAIDYDGLGRLAVSTMIAGGVTFVTRQSYNTVNGLPDVLTYPASTGSKPLRVRHHYDRGRLVRLNNVDGGLTFWQLNAVDSRGLVTDESLGNGIRLASTRDAVTGDLLARQAGPGGGSSHQNLAYAWDPAGNLLQREERNLGVIERFSYDSRDRLDLVTLNGATTLDIDHDEVGNIVRKSDVGNYSYDASRRQLVTAAGANTYAYDAGGAVVNASGTTISWLSYDLPAQITHPGGNSATFSYGPDRARFRQVANAGGVLSETLYAAGGLFERRSGGGVTTFRHHIVADGRRVAVHTRRSGASPTTVYLLEDHQGSVSGFTTSSGVLKARASYRPYGARRAGDWTGATPTSAEWSQINATTSRGYTDHEHLDNLGLVHMNGRVYDPVLGRFLSPDPIVQAPFDTQGLNRYAYVRNNPLRYRDPSGYCFNTHPAADHLVAQCLEQIFVSSFGISSTRLTEIWNLADYDKLLADLSRAGSVRGPLEPATDIATNSSAEHGSGNQEQPETAVTVEGRRGLLAGLTVAVPIMAPAWNSWGTAASGRLLAGLGAGASLAAALATPTELSESSELTDRRGEPHYLYHFTNQVGRLGIDASGFIAPGRSGRVYLSPLPYNTADSAQRALSLPRTPTGYYMIPRSNVPVALIWTSVAPNFGQPGGGLEASVGGGVSVAGAVWMDIGP